MQNGPAWRILKKSFFKEGTDIRILDYFMNEENYSLGKNGIPWRCGYFIRGRNDLCDGKWHKVKIPLNQFSDYGAWSNKDNKWCNSENLFDWKKIDCIRIDFGEKDLTEECCFRNIVIK